MYVERWTFSSVFGILVLVQICSVMAGNSFICSRWSHMMLCRFYFLLSFLSSLEQSSAARKWEIKIFTEAANKWWLTNNLRIYWNRDLTSPDFSRLICRNLKVSICRQTFRQARENDCSPFVWKHCNRFRSLFV